MKRQFVRIAALCTGLLLPAVIGKYSPHIDTEPSICPFLRFFHFPCPGCGLTKSIVHLYRGDPAGSIRYHPWGIALVAFCIWLLVVSLHDLLRKKETAVAVLDRPVLWQAVGIGVLITYLLRLAGA